MNTGVYKIVNSINGRFYIGSTIKNFNSRWIEHRTTLRKGKHRNRLLQADWMQYGENAFQFIVIEEVTPQNALKREQELLKRYFDGGIKCYNLVDLAIAGNKHGRPRKLPRDTKPVFANVPTDLLQRINELTPLFGQRTRLIVEALRREVERREAEQKKAG